ncbi:MAG: NTP transferase domain-containing protein [Chthoniobacterales bacterium]
MKQRSNNNCDSRLRGNDVPTANCKLPSHSNSSLTLVVLAAGMGSRYGGLKQLDPVGPHGEALLDYSVHDAAEAGFTEILFVIRKEIETLFQKHLKNRYTHRYSHLKINSVFQEVTDLPKQFSFPIARSKPWGTGHALLATRNHVTTPFAVVNADDYYGPSGYRLLKNFLLQLKVPTSTTTRHHSTYAMVAYALKNTLSKHGSVSRGICKTTKAHFISDIIERISIRKTSTGIIAEEKNEALPLSGEEWVSLNFWGFTPDIFSYLEQAFADFLKNKENHTSAEFYLPSAVNKLVHQKKISVKLLPTQDPWFGLTHPADVAHVKKALARIGLS